MQAQSVDFGKGLTWFGEGWELFMRNPGMWIVFMILLFVIAVVLTLVPVLGPLLLALLMPGLLGGLLYAAREASAQREMDFNHLFIAFKTPGTRDALLVLGAVMLGANILLMFLAMILVGGSMAGMMHGGSSGMLAAGLGIGVLLALVLMSVIGLLLAMAFFYAVPLVMFAAIKPVDAMKSSFAACLANLLPLLLFGVIYLVLMMIALVPFGLGLLVALPMTLGAMYASYRDVFAPPQFADRGAA